MQASTAGAPATRSCSTSPTRPSAGPDTTARRRARARPPRASAPRPTGGTAGRSPLPGELLRRRALRRALRRARTGAGGRATRRAATPAPTGTTSCARAGSAGSPRRQVVAQVERQEPRLLAREPGRHRNLVRVDREMHQRPRPSVTFFGSRSRPVLLDRVLDALAGQRVLQLRRRHRDPVHEQAQVERLCRCRIDRAAAGSPSAGSRRSARPARARPRAPAGDTTTGSSRPGRRRRGAAHRACRARRSPASSRFANFRRATVASPP